MTDQKSVIEIVCPHCGCDNDDQIEIYLTKDIWITVKELKRVTGFMCNQCSKEFKLEDK